MKAYIWIDDAREGVRNMAIDEALTHVCSQENIVVLRCYRWAEPFLTLGYFQRAADRLQDPLLTSLPFTRRLSGGGAIVHDRELTYSLVIPDASQAKSAAADIYCAVHTGIRAACKELGLTLTSFSCSRPAATVGSSSEGPEPFLCFERRSDSDLVMASNKIVGSAQRRINSTLLQHGSILLDASVTHLACLEFSRLPKTPYRIYCIS